MNHRKKEMLVAEQLQYYNNVRKVTQRLRTCILCLKSISNAAVFYIFLWHFLFVQIQRTINCKDQFSGRRCRVHFLLNLSSTLYQCRIMVINRYVYQILFISNEFDCQPGLGLSAHLLGELFSRP